MTYAPAKTVFLSSKLSNDGLLPPHISIQNMPRVKRVAWGRVSSETNPLSSKPDVTNRTKSNVRLIEPNHAIGFNWVRWSNTIEPSQKNWANRTKSNVRMCWNCRVFFRNSYTVNNSSVAFNCFTCKYGSFIYLTLSCGCCVEDRVLRN